MSKTGSLNVQIKLVSTHGHQISRKSNKESQLVVITPEVPADYSVKYDMKLSTYYNESKQSDEALVEFI